MQETTARLPEANELNLDYLLNFGDLLLKDDITRFPNGPAGSLLDLCALGVLARAASFFFV